MKTSASHPSKQLWYKLSGKGKHLIHYARIMFLACSFLCLQPTLQGCAEADSRFAHIYVRFVMDNILQAPVLYTACYSMGEFCTITAKNQQFIFENTRQQNIVNLMASNNYQGFSLGLSTGLIVGLPTIPEMGAMQSQVVCFDLACANCYRDYSICKRMQLKEGGKVYCQSCKRTYDLNNQGIICNGNEGRPLYRYKVSVNDNSLVVANQ